MRSSFFFALCRIEIKKGMHHCISFLVSHFPLALIAFFGTQHTMINLYFYPKCKYKQIFLIYLNFWGFFPQKRVIFMEL